MSGKRVLAIAPGVAVSLLPKLTCPFCWPAYAAALTSLGLGFLISERHFLMVSSALLSVSIGTLALRARQRRGYAPAAAGLFAAATILSGKFLFNSPAVAYAGATFLIAASVWNIWPLNRQADVCPNCAQSDAANFERTGEFNYEQQKNRRSL